jgi:DegV family protein with EDD domain
MVAEQMVAKVYLVGMMDTLFYLAKGGRIPKAAARMGDALKFKPIFTLSLGKPSLLTAVRTKSRGVERMLEIMRQKIGTMKLRQAIVMHANVLAEAERLKERIAADFDGAEVYVKDFSPVMGIHTGPGLLGIAFCVD